MRKLYKEENKEVELVEKEQEEDERDGCVRGVEK